MNSASQLKYNARTLQSVEERSSLVLKNMYLKTNPLYTLAMILFTGKGDDGTTQLFTSKKEERHTKSATIFSALGTVDELNTLIGWCRVACTTDWMVNERAMSTILLDVQNALFTIQAEIAGAEKSIPKQAVVHMEDIIHTIDSSLPPIGIFLIPGGVELSSRLDIARTVARRAERTVISLDEEGVDIDGVTKIYLNRLSSLLYALVRFVNHSERVDEQPPTYQ